jgi:glycosyltransferase involved in cell wall biosynthesis
MSKISLVIITLNEEKCIERCIRSVPFASEVVVVDSGSSDRTIEIAEKFGAKVYKNEWKGYGAQKSFAAGKASGDWVLSLDADEWLSPELQTVLKELTSMSGSGVFAMARLSTFLGRKIKHGGWFPDWQIRLYSKGSASWDPNESIHESLKTQYEVRKIAGLLYHEPFESIKEQVDVNFIYSKLIAETKFAKGKRIKCSCSIPIRVISRFFENYLLKGGFRDGFPGFVIAWNSAQSYMLQLFRIHKMTKGENTNV